MAGLHWCPGGDNLAQVPSAVPHQLGVACPHTYKPGSGEEGAGIRDPSLLERPGRLPAQAR